MQLVKPIGYCSKLLHCEVLAPTANCLTERHTSWARAQPMGAVQLVIETRVFLKAVQMTRSSVTELRANGRGRPRTETNHVKGPENDIREKREREEVGTFSFCDPPTFLFCCEALSSGYSRPMAVDDCVECLQLRNPNICKLELKLARTARKGWPSFNGRWISILPISAKMALGGLSREGAHGN